MLEIERFSLAFSLREDYTVPIQGKGAGAKAPALSFFLGEAGKGVRDKESRTPLPSGKERFI